MRQALVNQTAMDVMDLLAEKKEKTTYEEIYQTIDNNLGMIVDIIEENVVELEIV